MRETGRRSTSVAMPRGSALGGLHRLRERDEELGIVRRLAQALHEQLDSLVGAEGAEHAAHRPHHSEAVLVEEQLLTAGAGTEEVDGREDALLEEHAIEREF